MDYLYSKWNKVKKALKDRFIFLFLDYDGTISPIAGTPYKAVISKETRALLKKLSGHHKYKVAIISGRALKDIKNKIGLKHVIYAGNHGLEIEGPKIDFKYSLTLQHRAIIKDIGKKLKSAVRKFKGVIIENKTICLSLHYRLARREDVPLIKSLFQSAVLPYAAGGKVKISSGKKMLEVRPPVNWNKGSIAMWLLARERVFLKSKSIVPIYIGDDSTDEDAFKALREKGITIFVGKPRASGAKYYLKNTEEVSKFLETLIEA